jgi:hypothetical protein
MRNCLKNKTRIIELKIFSGLPEKGIKQLAEDFMGGNSGVEPFDKGENEIIKKFIRALFDSLAVEIKFKVQGKIIKKALPQAINIRGDSWELVFFDLERSRSFEVALESIEKIKLLDNLNKTDINRSIDE